MGWKTMAGFKNYCARRQAYRMRRLWGSHQHQYEERQLGHGSVWSQGNWLKSPLTVPSLKSLGLGVLSPAEGGLAGLPAQPG